MENDEGRSAMALMSLRSVCSYLAAPFAHLLLSTSQQRAVNAPPQLLHLLWGALVNQN